MVLTIEDQLLVKRQEDWTLVAMPEEDRNVFKWNTNNLVVVLSWGLSELPL